MNVFKLFFLLAVLFFIPLVAGSVENTIEIRGAALYHSSKLFREIYGKIGTDYQVQFATRFCDFELWGNIDGFAKSGKSVGFADSTHIHVVNLSVGLSYLYKMNCQLTLYLGAGPCFAGIWMKNKLTNHSHETVDKTAFGSLFKAGLYYNITDWFFIDIFVDYVYQPVHFNHKRHHSIDIGGLKPGVGLGINF